MGPSRDGAIRQENTVSHIATLAGSFPCRSIESIPVLPWMDFDGWHHFSTFLNPLPRSQRASIFETYKQFLSKLCKARLYDVNFGFCKVQEFNLV